MTQVFDPFLMEADDDEATQPHDYIRGRHDYAMILQPDGSRIGYVGPSTVMGQVESGIGLQKWKTRHLALSLAKPANVDILHALSTMEYGSRGLDQKVNDAIERLGLSAKANVGTAIHRFLEPDWNQADTPEQYRGHVQSYNDELARIGLEIILWDQNVVNDSLRTAGTYDIALRCPRGTVATIAGREVDLSGKVILGEVKTGANLKWVDWSGQLGLYSHSQHYDVVTDVRSPIHPDLEPDVGIVFVVSAETGKTTSRWVDLDIGYRVAQLACLKHAQGSRGQHIIGTVHDAPVQLEQDDPLQHHAPDFAAEIMACASRATLRALWITFDGATQDEYRDMVCDRLRDLPAV